MRDIIAEKVQPFLRNTVGGMLMHDNAPPCRARVTQEFLQCAGFTVMPWLLVSPHLNPIGNVDSHEVYPERETCGWKQR